MAALSPAAPVYPSGTTSVNACAVSVKITYPYPSTATAITNSIFIAQ